MYIIHQQFTAILQQEASLRNVLLAVSNEMTNTPGCQMYMITAANGQVDTYELVAIFDDLKAYKDAMEQSAVQDLLAHLPKYAINSDSTIKEYGIVGGYFNLGNQ